MRTNVVVFWLIAVFFGIVAIAYTVWALADPFGEHRVEWVGTVVLALSSVFAGFIAYYVGRVHKAQRGELPEDRLDSNIDDGDPEVGFFSPWSWWPFMLGGSAALVFLGLAVGFWIAFIGVAVAVLSLVGWIFEYYRGNFSR